MQTSTVLNLRSPLALADAIATYGRGHRKLSAEVDISPARLSQLLAGEKPRVAAPTAVRLATALDKEVRALFDFPDGDDLVRLGLITV